MDNTLNDILSGKYSGNTAGESEIADSIATKIKQVKRTRSVDKVDRLLSELDAEAKRRTDAELKAVADAEKNKKKNDIQEILDKLAEEKNYADSVPKGEPVQEFTRDEIISEVVPVMEKFGAFESAESKIAEYREEAAAREAAEYRRTIEKREADRLRYQEMAEDTKSGERIVPHEQHENHVHKLRKLTPISQEASRDIPAGPIREEQIVQAGKPPVHYEQPVKNITKKKKAGKKKTLKEKFIGLFPQKDDSIAEKIRKVIFMCSVIAIMVCGYMVADYYIDLWQSEKLHNEIAEIYTTYPEKRNLETNESSYNNQDENKVYYLLDAAKKLLDKNGDVIGYMSIEGTPVSNPVMRAEDNSKYLHVDLEGNDSRNGELFMDYRNHFDDVVDGRLSVANSDNLVVYGHNMANDTMFGSLKYYQRDDGYYLKHPIIQFNSNYECYTYKIFAYFLADARDESETRYDVWNKLNFYDEYDFYHFVNEAKRRTIRKNDVDVKYGDKLLTLSTCNTILGERGRLIVMARLVRDGEDLYKGTKVNIPNNNVKWPTLYYEMNGIYQTYDPDAEFTPYGNEVNPDAVEEVTAENPIQETDAFFNNEEFANGE